MSVFLAVCIFLTLLNHSEQSQATVQRNFNSAETCAARFLMKGSIEWGTAWCCANFKHSFCYIALLNVRQHGTSTIKLKQIPIRNVVSGWHEVARTQRPRWDCWRLTGQDLNYCCWKNSSGRKFCKSLAITSCHLNLKHRPCTVKSFLF